MLNHQELYEFWCRSMGTWTSPLLTLQLRWLDNPELLPISEAHHLSEPEFGISMSWTYNKKAEAGHMAWIADASHPNAVFTDKSIWEDTPPSVFNYQLFAAKRLVMTTGEYEETVFLQSDSRRLREQRYGGKLMRRLWEDKVAVDIPQWQLRACA
ncbi:hypothetical protein [Leptolyngbya sp. FACHB-261]|uniref:hypothetical protein n=1 Tax=Leptolyngbya sp. FACHB-261 TaxID=2692806 RepID=UPI0016841AEA|nr:hypothetical protein [Leptolyngbya sp. FACHB-261]MBD2101499.1 hypothetical protein [Leptolyngbya sp. FACHB-261]